MNFVQKLVETKNLRDIELFIDAKITIQKSNQMDIKYSIHVGGLAG